MSLKNVGKKERIETILERIKNRIPFTLVVLAKEIGITKKTIDRDIEELKKTKRIRFIGSKRSGHYELMREGRIGGRRK